MLGAFVSFHLCLFGHEVDGGRERFYPYRYPARRSCIRIFGQFGVRLLAVDGYAFKDLNRNGLLDPYEDWRLTPEERAVDLAGQLSTEEIAGLMLYSAHQSIPGASKGFGASTYNGKSFDEWSPAIRSFRCAA